MQAVVRFFRNPTPDRRNPAITRTLGKIGFVDSAVRDTASIDTADLIKGFWIVEVLRELSAGSPQGCFLLRPIRGLEVEEVCKVMPGLYKTDQIDPGTIVVYPFKPDVPCVLPVAIKNKMRDDDQYHSIVVAYSTNKDVWTRVRNLAPMSLDDDEEPASDDTPAAA
jgi:hypothetical protein